MIPGWDAFQHYRDRNPKWIKDYVEQLDRDEYMGLTLAERGLLADIRKLYARRFSALPGKPATLTRLLNQPVREKQLQRLAQAGFIEFSASKPLAIPYQPARPEKIKREREIRDSASKPRPNGEVVPGAQGPRSTPTGGVTCPHCGVLRPGPASLAEHVANVHYDLTPMGGDAL